MACVSQRPRIDDGNGRIMEKLCAPGASSQPKSPPRLLRNPRKMVVVKVEPSYISSDLFTPFSEPRSTLPSIAEFVRPRYGSEKTWGTVTSSYGGVGPACQLFKKRGQGSISRSHRHYGSGCINYCIYEDELDCGDHHRTRKPLHEHEPVAEATPTSGSSATTKNVIHPLTAVKAYYDDSVPLSVTTASAIKNVSATLYGTSSYNKDFSSTLCTPHVQERYSTQPALIHHEVTDTPINPTLQEWDGQTAKDEEFCGRCQFCAEGNDLESEGYEDPEKELDSYCESNDEEYYNNESEQAVAASNVATHGHMICVSHYTNILPSHVIVSSLSELPTHFRRVTTKYTRNRCPLLPCRVPHYLLRKHQLLPSVITALPSKKKSGQLPSVIKGRQISAMAEDTISNYCQSVSGKKSAKAKNGQLSAIAMKDAQISAVSKDTAMTKHTKFTGSREKSATPKDVQVSAKTKAAGENGTVAAKHDTVNKSGGSRLAHLVSSQKNQWMEHHKSEHQKLSGRHHNHYPSASGKVTLKGATQGAGVDVKDTIVLSQQPEVKGHVRRHSHMTQHLGQKFKTEAHTRYHSLFPDHVPDLQTLEPAKRHTFFGYHTSVFRG